MNDQTAAQRHRATRWASVFAIVAGVVGLGSVAWACTQIMGHIKVCSPSTATCSDTTTTPDSVGHGAAGSTVKVRASGLIVKPATYALYFADSRERAGDALTEPKGCHSATTILKNPSGAKLNKMTTDTQGNLDRDLTTAGIQPYKAVIPATASQGDAEICAREVTPQPERSATMHAIFTVIGGS